MGNCWFEMQSSWNWSTMRRMSIQEDLVPLWLAETSLVWWKLFWSSRRIAASTPAATRSAKNLSVSPPRITSNVKHTLQLIKIFKEYRRNKLQERSSTSYRRKKANKLSSDDLGHYEDSSMTEVCLTYEGHEVLQSVLLVDGYNLCGFWPKLKKDFLHGNLELARKKLVDELVNFSATRGVKVVIAFDAVQSGFPNSMETFASVDIVFTSMSCADAWIEKEVSRLALERCPKIWVATSDTNHRLAALGSGAYVWSCRKMIAEIKETKKELQQFINESYSYSMRGKLLEDNLDPKVFNSLQNLKKNLNKA